MKNKASILFVLFAVLLFNQGSAEAFFAIDVFHDGYIDDFETSGTLDGIPDRISDTNALLAGNIIVSSGAAIDSRAIMTFDVGGYFGKQLVSAILTGYGTRVDTQTPPLGPTDSILGSFYGYAGDGLVGLNDFDAPANFLGNLQFTPNGSFDLDPFQLNVKSSLQGLLDNSDRYVEYRVQSDQYTVFINAGEVGPSSQHDTDGRWPGPKLLLEFEQSQNVVPEPSTMILFGSGLLGAFFKRRRVQSNEG